MLVRIEPLKSFIAARSLLSSIGTTTILTRRVTQAAFSTNYEANIVMPLTLNQFGAARDWVDKIAKQSVPVSESWIDNYVEAIAPPPRISQRHEGKGQTAIVKLDLPFPDDKQKTKEILINRRRQLKEFAKIRNALDSLIRRSAADTNWSPEKIKSSIKI